MRISDWSSDVCSSDLAAVEMDQDAVAFDIDAIDGRREARRAGDPTGEKRKNKGHEPILPRPVRTGPAKIHGRGVPAVNRSEEHTSELQSLMRISYAVFCLQHKKVNPTRTSTNELNKSDTLSLI